MAVLSTTTKTGAKAAKTAAKRPRMVWSTGKFGVKATKPAAKLGAKAAKPAAKVAVKAGKPMAKRRARRRADQLGDAARMLWATGRDWPAKFSSSMGRWSHGYPARISAVGLERR